MKTRSSIEVELNVESKRAVKIMRGMEKQIKRLEESIKRLNRAEITIEIFSQNVDEPILRIIARRFQKLIKRLI